MVRQLGDAGWTLRQKVALTCRALFDGGHDSGLAGQITARAEQLPLDEAGLDEMRSLLIL